MKTTQKSLKEFNAIDITYYDFDRLDNLRHKENGFETVAVSFGTYGMNGGLFQGHNSKQLYKIISRTSALFQLV